MDSRCFILLCLTIASSKAWFTNDNNQNNNLHGTHFQPRQDFNFIPSGNRNDQEEKTPTFNNNNNNNQLNSVLQQGGRFEGPTPAPEAPKEDVSNVNSVVSPRCSQRKTHDIRAHPLDCSKFSICTGGTLITLSCSEGSVFHELSGSCVPKGSAYDTCSRRQQTLLTCPPGATYKKAHPKECAQFYHCGMPAQESHWEEHLHECAYPMLYNDRTNQCEHYSTVLCGARREPMDPCEYKVSVCARAHCVPCNVRHPSCRGHRDGLNAWKGREGSPYYVVCNSQRVVYKGMCAQTRGVQIFDHQARSCKFLSP